MINKIFKVLVSSLLIIVIAAIIGIGAGIVYLTANEYSPDSVEAVDFYGSPTITVNAGDKLKVMTYNISFGAIGRDSDYYTDGGKTTEPPESSFINENIDSIIELSMGQMAHINFFQQVDINAKRSCAIDEANLISNGMYGRSSAFAFDQKCKYVPKPYTAGIGEIESGILTLTRFAPTKAERRALSDGCGWPVSTWERKPAMLVERVKLENSSKELVLINLNFDMYGAQTVRKSEYKELCEFMQMEFSKGNYIIAGGSFASLLPSVSKTKNPPVNTMYFEPVELTTENLTGGWKYCTDDSSPTMRLLDAPYDGNSNVYVTDGFITSPNTIVERTTTIDTDFRFSSHNPVVTEVTLVK